MGKSGWNLVGWRVVLMTQLVEAAKCLALCFSGIYGMMWLFTNFS